MKNFRIEFTATELFAGNMVDRKHSTKWMTMEECLESKSMTEPNAKIIKLGGCDMNGQLLVQANYEKAAALTRLKEKDHGHENFWYHRGRLSTIRATLEALDIEKELCEKIGTMIAELEAAEQEYLNR